MRTFLRIVLPVVTLCGISACSGLTPMQETADDFSHAAHEVGKAQIGLFRQVQMAECNRTFFNQAFAYATAQKDRAGRFEVVPLNLTATCQPQELTDEQLAIRQKLLDSITLYADTIQTIATGKENEELGNHSRKLAKNLQELARQQSIAAVDSDHVALVNTAVVTLAGMALDHAKFKNIKEAANTAHEPLAAIVGELKEENVADAKGLASKADVMSGAYRMAISSARDARGPASFMDIVASRNTLQTMIVPEPNVAELNELLDSLVEANHALATAKNGKAKAIVSDLVRRARQAAAYYKASR